MDWGPDQCGSVGWLSVVPQKQTVACWIPSQGTCLGCRFGPQSGHVQQAPNRCFSLSPSPSLALSKNR